MFDPNYFASSIKAKIYRIERIWVT